MRMPDLKEATLIVKRLSVFVSHECDIITLQRTLSKEDQNRIHYVKLWKLSNDLMNVMLMILKELQPHDARLIPEALGANTELMQAIGDGTTLHEKARQLLLSELNENETPANQDEKNTFRFIVRDEQPQTWKKLP